MRSTVTLDRYDIKILEYLQWQGRCSNVDLAAAIGLSDSPCLARTKRLQESGIIRGYNADIALEKICDHVTVFAEVTLKNHRLHDFRVFETSVGKYPEILECYNISGGYDYLMKIVAPNISCFQALMERLLEDDVGIDKFFSRIVLRKPLAKRHKPLGLLITGGSSCIS
jgi:DNA-binding Lrp family transcriptional regulator